MVSRVYADPAGQFIIEDDRDDEGNRIITTKRVETRTAALSALRCTYTLVVVFLVRCMNCLQVLGLLHSLEFEAYRWTLYSCFPPSHYLKHTGWISPRVLP